MKEIRTLFKDEGTILFCLILPLTYPIVYSWIYNNNITLRNESTSNNSELTNFILEQM